MKTKTIKVCDAIKFDIACKRNDPVDIAAGGPTILGYEFYVSPDENEDEIKKFLKECFKINNRSLIGISVYEKRNYPVNELWTREQMKLCIEENDIY